MSSCPTYRISIFKQMVRQLPMCMLLLCFTGITSIALPEDVDPSHSSKCGDDDHLMSVEMLQKDVKVWKAEKANGADEVLQRDKTAGFGDSPTLLAVPLPLKAADGQAPAARSWASGVAWGWLAGAMLMVCTAVGLCVFGLAASPRAGEAAVMVDQTSSVRVLQVFFVVVVTVFVARGSVVLPQSYALATELGSGATFSGVIIGSFWVFLMVGQTLSNWFFVQPWNQERNRLVIVVALAAYCALDALMAFLASPLPSWQLGNFMRGSVFIAGRSCYGLLQGFSVFLLRIMVVKVTPTNEVVSIGIWRNTATVFGAGLGAMVPWMVNSCSQGFVSDTDLLSASLMTLAILLLSLPIIGCGILPSNLEPFLKWNQNAFGSSASSAVRPQESLAVEAGVWRASIVKCALAYTFLRCLMTTALTAASTLILEEEFHLTPHDSGLRVGWTLTICLLTTPLLNMIRRGGIISDVHLLKAFSLIVMLSAILFDKNISSLIAGQSRSWIVVLVADCIIFSACVAGNGCTEGFAVQNSIPNTIYSKENFMYFDAIAGACSNIFAPVLARSVLALGGRNVYMLFQCCFGFSLVVIAFCVGQAKCNLDEPQPVDKQSKPFVQRFHTPEATSSQRRAA